jgi:hypothetical protein
MLHCGRRAGMVNACSRSWEKVVGPGTHCIDL